MNDSNTKDYLTALEWDEQNHNEAIERVNTLFAAIRAGDLEEVHLLGQDEELLFRANEKGVMAIHCAAYCGQTEVVRYLVERHVDPSAPLVIRDGISKKFTALQIARAQGHQETAKVLEEVQARRHEADQASLRHQFERLLRAASAGDLDEVRDLIHDAELWEERLTAMQLETGVNAVHLAAESGHAEIVQHLIDHGAHFTLSARMEDGNSYSPLDLAKAKGHQAVVEVLEKAIKKEDEDEEDD
ncbi:ankyrin repeat domain-containing protein [Burkholderia vietnamiensis]|uniref:ankyrin repeat domain-containing protein n=1 Tax=Burkholderia vietnamiensis TaxID=60552 RepID=UPI001CF5C42A|nr:ankyrin repeat domain-containing protein [Burkholderia vietnamiensis]MCA8180703.1 ankyrin repeat domain-containing protein [Burkholderia vietnamiensis]